MTVVSASIPIPTLPLPGLSSLCLAVLERSPLAMAAVEGNDFVVRFANPAFCHLLGKSREKIVGHAFCKFVPIKNECLGLLARVMRTGLSETHSESGLFNSKPVSWSYVLWPVLADKPDGGVMIQIIETEQNQEKTVAMNEALVLGSIRQHELTAVADLSNARLEGEIGERKLVEAALHRAQALLTDRAGQLEGLVTERTSELTATNAQLETFAYSIAHDLRAPLRAMQAFSAMLLEESGETLSETGRDYAQRIDKSAQFMDALLCDLLAFSRISQQRVELVPIHLEPIVKGVVHRLKSDIGEKNARVETPGPWPTVMAHELTLVQVLFNLVSNALKFIAPGVQPHIRIWAEETNLTEPTRGNQPASPALPSLSSLPSVKVFVQDNGVGIAADYHEQIFKLFTRLLGDKYAGTGIGLAIVQKGIERMGGKAGVASEAGKGSKFWFELKKA